MRQHTSEPGDSAAHRHPDHDHEPDLPAGRIELSGSRIGARVSALAGGALGAVIVLSPSTVTSVVIGPHF